MMKKQCSLCGKIIRPAAHAVLDHTNQLLCPNPCGRVYNLLAERDKLFGRAGMMALAAHAQRPSSTRFIGSRLLALSAGSAAYSLAFGNVLNKERVVVEAIVDLLTVLDEILESSDEQQSD